MRSIAAVTNEIDNAENGARVMSIVLLVPPEKLFHDRD